MDGGWPVLVNRVHWRARAGPRAGTAERSGATRPRHCHAMGQLGCRGVRPGSCEGGLEFAVFRLQVFDACA